MPLLGYGKKWQNFTTAIDKAIISCTATGNIVEQHFTDASKSSPMPHGGERELKDYSLSRFACYLVAQNGDPRKEEIAAAQVYFAISTRAHEIHQLLEEQNKRLEVRLKDGPVGQQAIYANPLGRNRGCRSVHFDCPSFVLPLAA